jgi:protein SCO1/2
MRIGSDRRPDFSRASLLLLACTLVLVSGCQHDSAKHYTLHGQVLGKSARIQQITLNHEEIPGFMAAMAMPYPVEDPKGFAAAQPGDRITADVVVQKDGKYWLDHIAITDQSGRATAEANPPLHQLLPGEQVPDVPFTNQDDKTVHLSQFKGKAVLLTFIYTRCPFPDYCPLLSSEFATIHQELAMTPTGLDKTHLISVSLDPEVDTPPVLRKYGLGYLKDDPAGFKNWDFVATTPYDLQKLATGFGLQYFKQGNLVAHSMSTVLLAPDGTVAQTWEGNEWRPPEVLAALRQAAGQAN